MHTHTYIHTYRDYIYKDYNRKLFSTILPCFIHCLDPSRAIQIVRESCKPEA